MAKYSRGASICIAPRLPSTHTITTSATAAPAAGTEDGLADLGDEGLSLGDLPDRDDVDERQRGRRVDERHDRQPEPRAPAAACAPDP